MSETVFILGAGASKAAGAPLMGDFLDTSRDLWRRGRVGNTANNFADVFQAVSALQSVHSKSQLDLDNIESVFATLEMAITLRKFPGPTDEQVKGIVDSLKVVIGATLEETLQLPVVRNRPQAPVPYGGFAGLVRNLSEKVDPKQKVSIITFNYDLACDFALFQAGMAVDYALGEATKQDALPLLKLHGSLNWAYCPKLQRVVPWTMPSYFTKYHYDIWDDETRYVRLAMMPQLRNFKYEDNDVVPEPVLVPPTWNKTEYHRNLSDVWSRAAKELTSAENIFIIGYSLPETDAFFRYLYALGTVGSVLLRRVWVFNPDGKVEPRYRQILGPAANTRFRFFPQTFEESITTISGAFGI